MGKFGQGSSKQIGNISDKRLSEILEIPTRTFNDWKKQDSNNWRYILYCFLKSLSEEEVLSYLEKSKEIKQELLKE